MNLSKEHGLIPVLRQYSDRRNGTYRGGMRLPVRIPHLDCCDEPILEVRKVLFGDDHDRRSILVCLSCGTFWFNRFYEHIYFDSDTPDSQIEWHVRLSQEEATDAISSGHLPRLGGRECFKKDGTWTSIEKYPPF